jgi:hypothetical protein
MPADLAAVEARLRAILAPYEGRSHGPRHSNPMPVPARADWFASSKRASTSACSCCRCTPGRTSAPGCRRHWATPTGKSAFNFTAIDEAEMAELEALVARAFERYMAEVANPGP